MKITGEDGITRVYKVHKGILRVIDEFQENTDLRVLNWVIGPPLILTDFFRWD